MEILDIAKKIVSVLDEKKAQDIVLLDIREVSTLADYFVIASGNNAKHSSSLSEYVEYELSELDIKTHHTEGQKNGDWVILDYMDIIVHVFAGDKRDIYALDKLWSDAKRIEL